MASKKDNLPMNADVSLNNGGTITYANEVVAIIAGVAASEVEGVAGMVSNNGIGDMISKNRNVTRGIKVELGTAETAIDVYTVVEYGRPVHKVASEVQESVRKAVENMTGLHVVRVDVHVAGISFEKEKAAQGMLEAGKEKIALNPVQEKEEKPEEEVTVEAAQTEENEEAVASEEEMQEESAPAQEPAEENETEA